MKKLKTIVFTFMILVMGFSVASATMIDLYDWGFNIDGTLYLSPDIYSPPAPGQLPVYFDYSGFGWSSGPGTGGGLGNIRITYNPGIAGNYSFISFFDHEIDEPDNTFSNEYGEFATASGSLSVGQTWEIDEPGWVFGDIYTNFSIGALDNSNAIPFGSDPTSDGIMGDDVSMALGWNFTLAQAGDIATITLRLADTAPGSGFYLTQTDPDSQTSIYFSGSLDITPIPEPGTLMLLGSGLLGLIGLGRKRSLKR